MDYILNNFNERSYRAEELRFQYSGLVQSELTETWGIKYGVSFLATQLHEIFKADKKPNEFNYNGNFNEIQSGIFGEAVYATEKFKWVSGARIDYHNIHGFFATPRTHMKIDINRNNIVFLQGGYGRRQSYLLSENVPYFINQRKIIGLDINTRGPYGFQQERGWNYGVSYLKRFMFLDFPSSLSLDVFRNQFDYRIA